MEKLGINPILLLAQIVNFAIILFLMKKYLYAPILKLLDERKKKVEETDKAFLEAKSKTEEVALEKTETLKQAKDEAATIISQAKVQTQKEKEVVMEKAQAEIVSTREKLQKDMEVEKQEMTKGLKAQVAELVVLVAEKVVRESLDDKLQQKMIADSISDLEKVVLH